MVARLGDDEPDVTSPNFEERWRRFLACMNLYQFLGNFHFATSSEVTSGSVEPFPFEASSGISIAWAVVRDGVFSSLRHVVEELAVSLPSGSRVPKVEYYNENIDDDAFAEMAWPEREPPIAVLAGDQEAFVRRWQEGGWRIFTPDQLQAQGVTVLVEQLNR
jgi:DEAD/DEAH box helicase domain-containing protein